MLDETNEQHWRRLAAEAIAWAKYEESRGLFGGTFRNKAALYESAAKAAEISERTGVPHCACHHKPFPECKPSAPRAFRWPS